VGAAQLGGSQEWAEARDILEGCGPRRRRRHREHGAGQQHVGRPRGVMRGVVMCGAAMAVHGRPASPRAPWAVVPSCLPSPATAGPDAPAGARVWRRLRSGSSRVRLVFVTPEKVGPCLPLNSHPLLDAGGQEGRARALATLPTPKAQLQLLLSANHAKRLLSPTIPAGGQERRMYAFFLNLLVPPFQVAKSDALVRLLDGLQAEGRLDRVVVDEVG
jgi:hypothetical protein